MTAHHGLVGLALLATLVMVPARPAVAVISDTLQIDSDAASNVEVAVELARAAFSAPTSTVVVSREDVFADALASGVLQGDAPLLLVPKSGPLPNIVAAFLGDYQPQRTLLLGGEGAITQDVANQIAATGTAVERLAGATRIETALRIAETAAATDTIIVTRAFGTADDPTRAFADALAAGALAAERGWPILPTDSSTLSPAVRDWVSARNIVRAIIVGGQAAVAPAVAGELAGIVASVERLSGATRAETALAVAAERGAASASDANGVVLVEAEGADAWVGGLTAAGLAARRRAPVLLASGTEIPSSTRTFLSSGFGVEQAAGTVVVTCVIAYQTCEEGRRLLGLVPRVEVTFDPPAGSTVGTGTPVTITLSELPDAEILASGTCLGSVVDLRGPEVDLRVDRRAESRCTLSVSLLHPNGVLQTETIDYVSDADLFAVPGCPLGAAQLSADGRRVAYVIDDACPEHTGPRGGGQLVVVEVGTRERTVIDVPGAQRFYGAQLSPSGQYAFVLGDAEYLVDIDRGTIEDVASLYLDGASVSDRRNGIWTDNDELLLRVQPSRDSIGGTFQGDVLYDVGAGREVNRLQVCDYWPRCSGSPNISRDGSVIVGPHGVLRLADRSFTPWPVPARAPLLLDADATTAVFETCPEGALGPCDMAVIDLATMQVRLVPYSGQPGNLSGDGRWLTVGSSLGLQGAIDLQAGRLRAVAAGSGFQPPRISDDARTLLIPGAESLALRQDIDDLAAVSHLVVSRLDCGAFGTVVDRAVTTAVGSVADDCAGPGGEGAIARLAVTDIGDGSVVIAALPELEGDQLGRFEVSPDGQFVVVQGRDANTSGDLYVIELATLEVTSLNGQLGVDYLFWGERSIAGNNVLVVSGDFGDGLSHGLVDLQTMRVRMLDGICVEGGSVTECTTLSISYDAQVVYSIYGWRSVDGSRGAKWLGGLLYDASMSDDGGVAIGRSCADETTILNGCQVVRIDVAASEGPAQLVGPGDYQQLGAVSPDGAVVGITDADFRPAVVQGTAVRLVAPELGRFNAAPVVGSAGVPLFLSGDQASYVLAP